MPIPRTDRRDSPRFELIGPVWADVELPERAPVLNASEHGLLIETYVCPGLNSRYATTIRDDEHERTVTATVRHVRPTEGGRTFLVGLEIGPDSVNDQTIPGSVRGIDTKLPTPQNAPAEDRRRAPRLGCNTTVVADLSWPRPVRIVDISSSGILLASRQRSAVGARGFLKFIVGEHRFVAAVELRRQKSYHDASGFHLGARFLGLIDHRKGIIESLSVAASAQRPEK